MAEIASDFVSTLDGVRLHYLHAGAGPALVLLPGWSQTAAMYRYQIEELSNDFRVLAIDHRGHGESDKPVRGYRIPRLACDVHEALLALNLDKVTLMGHSMACSVIWSYWDHFRDDRLARLILVDQGPSATAWPASTEQERNEAGSLFDPQSLFAIAERLRGPNGVRITEGVVEGFFTPAFPKELKDWVLEENLKMPREYAARLLVNQNCQDWRDVIPTIDLPTLVVSGRASGVSTASQAWIASQIPGARLEIFEADEGGSHFMWLENPAKFNQLVREFILQQVAQ